MPCEQGNCRRLTCKGMSCPLSKDFRMNGPTGPAHRPLASRGIFPACGHAGLTDGDEGFEEFGDGGCVGPAELARDVGN